MKKLLLFFFIIFSVVCSAQVNDECRHRLSLNGSISMDDSYDYGAGYHYLICDYVGVGARIGAWSLFPDGGIIGETAEERSNRENLYFKPSVLLMSPTMFSIGNCSFRIECEPAVMISMRQRMTAFCGSSNTYAEYKSDCFSWHCDLALGVNYRNLTFLLGYSLSNIDINRDYDDCSSYSKNLISSIGVKVGVNF